MLILRKDLSGYIGVCTFSISEELKEINNKTNLEIVLLDIKIRMCDNLIKKFSPEYVYLLSQTCSYSEIKIIGPHHLKTIFLVHAILRMHVLIMVLNVLFLCLQTKLLDQQVLWEHQIG